MIEPFMSIDDFCRAHGICKRTFHYLQARGVGPETLQIGRRRLISEEAAKAWRSRIARPLTQEEANMIADHTVAAFPKLVAEYGEDAGAVFEQRLHTLLQAFGVLDPPELDLLAGNAGAAVAN
jgi:hypothetical protein